MDLKHDDPYYESVMSPTLACETCWKKLSSMCVGLCIIRCYWELIQSLVQLMQTLQVGVDATHSSNREKVNVYPERVVQTPIMAEVAGFSVHYLIKVYDKCPHVHYIACTHFQYHPRIEHTHTE